MDDAVAKGRAPVERRFFDAIDRRGSLTRQMALASPASLLALALDEVAGSSEARVARFRREVDAFQTQFASFFNARTMRGERLTLTSIAERPTFRFEDEPAPMWPLFALAAWVLVMVALTSRRVPHAVGLDEPTAKRATLAAQS